MVSFACSPDAMYRYEILGANHYDDYDHDASRYYLKARDPAIHQGCHKLMFKPLGLDKANLG